MSIDWRPFYDSIDSGAELGEAEPAGVPYIILGGGPSLSAVDANLFLELQPGCFLVGVNSAGYLFADVSLCYAGDIQWMERFSQDDRFSLDTKRVSHWQGIDGTSEDVSKGWHRLKPSNDGVLRWPKSLKDGIPGQDNRGLEAIMLADALGASSIFLLGFDLHADIEPGKKNFHIEYPPSWQHEGRRYLNMLASFGLCLPSCGAPVYAATDIDGRRSALGDLVEHVPLSGFIRVVEERMNPEDVYVPRSDVREAPER